jgi:TonB dependent receptor
MSRPKGRRRSATQVAGFNQLFDDINGTDAWRYGAALDYEATANVFFGVEYSERELDVPIGSIAPGGGTEILNSDEKFARAYAYWTPMGWLALSGEYQFERVEQDVDASPFGLAEASTHRVPLEARFSHPTGLFARVRGTFVDQDGRFENFQTGEIISGSDTFWVADVGLGYRFPKRWGLASIEVRNLFDENFQFQDTDPGDPRLGPERTIFRRLTITF